MAFCINCGQQLPEGAKFCAECGTSINAEPTSSKRRIVYEGKVHKCPQCGNVLNSFVVVCPACGYELRDGSTATAVKEFSNRLDAATTEVQKANVIRSFPIPNTKEDIFEFMILASSNIDEHPNKDVFDAWIAKFEQCYAKAKISFKHDSDFSKIYAIYTATIKEIRRIKRKGPLKKFLIIAIPVLVFIIANIAFWSWIASGYPNEEEEVARLEAIVVEVETALANKEYDLAMMHAKSIDYSAWTANDELERQWDIKRDYLIKKVIAMAAEDGIVMEYPTDTADEKDKNNGDDNQTSSGTDSSTPSNGQDTTSYVEKSVKNYTFNIADYWSEEGSKNEYLQYYAEKGDKVVMLSIGYPEETDDNYEVSFEGLYADNENMIDAVGAMFTDGDVYNYEVFESKNGVKGVLYSFTYKQKVSLFNKEDGSGYCFCFPSPNDRRWFYVTLLYTNNVASSEYVEDYMEMISNIKVKQ